MTHTLDDHDLALAREKNHAKLLSYRERQALVFLHRRDDERLAIIVQLWVAGSDEQLRVSIAIDDVDDSDEIIQRSFDDLSDESLEMALDELGIPGLIEEIVR